jgi:hypothetical protein
LVSGAAGGLAGAGDCAGTAGLAAGAAGAEDWLGAAADGAGVAGCWGVSGFAAGAVEGGLAGAADCFSSAAEAAYTNANAKTVNATKNPFFKVHIVESPKNEYNFNSGQSDSIIFKILDYHRFAVLSNIFRSYDRSEISCSKSSHIRIWPG